MSDKKPTPATITFNDIRGEIKTKEQLDRIEEKLDKLLGILKKEEVK